MQKTLELTEIAICRDGGTIHCVDAEGGQYYVDHRIGTETYGFVYDKYPGHVHATIVAMPGLYTLKKDRAILDELKAFAEVPLLSETDADDMLRAMIKSAIHTSDPEEGVRLLMVWWTQLVAFKQIADDVNNAFHYITGLPKHNLIKNAKVLQQNMEVAQSDFETFKKLNAISKI